LKAASLSYSRLQMGLHWLVVVLVIIQYATSGSIARTHAVSMSGLAPNSSDLFWHVVHNRNGLFIFAIMALRLVVRYWQGVPTPVENTPLRQAKAANVVHLLIYATLMMQAFTGAVASYVWWPMSVVHQYLFYIFASLVALHISAAFWHHFILKDETLRRIVRITKN
jgi:cytochrome b561